MHVDMLRFFFFAAICNASITVVWRVASFLWVSTSKILFSVRKSYTKAFICCFSVFMCSRHDICLVDDLQLVMTSNTPWETRHLDTKKGHEKNSWYEWNKTEKKKSWWKPKTRRKVQTKQKNYDYSFNLSNHPKAVSNSTITITILTHRMGYMQQLLSIH